jgi:hypothetical protein
MLLDFIIAICPLEGEPLSSTSATGFKLLPTAVAPASYHGSVLIKYLRDSEES